MSENSPLIQVRGISKHFGGVAALRNVNIDFFPGEVHCIAGENGCGKSTLMKVLSGAHRPTSGHVTVDSTDFGHLTPRQAYGLGIEVIYQDFSLMPNLTAAENIALPGHIADRKRLIRDSAIRATAQDALDRLGIDLELNTPVGELTVAERQLCAVARAMAHNARFIAMDEPTTALTWREVDALFAAVRRLRDSGVSIVFISHKMQEVFSISDRVTVMRNGQVIETGRPGDFTHASLAETMTGRTTGEIERVAPAGRDRPPALEVEGLTLDPLFADVSFNVRQGEIIGLSGLLGSGRTEIAEAIAGLRPAAAGRIAVRGNNVAIRSLPQAIKAGIGYVPEDRLTQGLFLEQPIGDNIIATNLDRYSGPWGFLKHKAIAAAKSAAVRDLRIKVGNLANPVKSLSGGNAQRVLLAKWLVGEPKVLILNGPTVGVDVGSKFDILGVLNAQSLRGLGIVIISDDVPELTSMCHRVLVVRSGRIVDELAGSRLTEDGILEAVAS